jgi:UDP-N-acetylmuramoyl-L-alanyl-D-glutamate--2,6-diaminopimelate ligase
LYKAGTIEIKGAIDKRVYGISMNSKTVKRGYLFVAVKGTVTDGHKYIDNAVKQGAVAVVCNKFPLNIEKNVTYVKVKDTSYALGNIASNFYDNPSEQLKLVGVTGTNGKTTVVTLLHKLFMALGYKTGLLSTVVNKINNRNVESTHTTPDAVSLNALLRQMVDAGCDYAFMEVSSHAIVQQRIAGLTFAGGVFTNLTHDHLDYHKTFKEYLKAKKSFFDNLPKHAFALTNADDKNGNVMIQNCKARKYSYALKKIADFKAKIIENSFEGLQLNINGHDIYSLLVGEFNAYNLLSVFATANLLGIPDYESLTQLSKLKGAEGRFDVIRSPQGVIAVIDYAHTPDALKNVLQTINAVRPGNGQLITVVGAGGNRDKLKRPEMAEIASQLSNKLILTSDNPRFEKPEAILDDMIAGVDVVNRRKTLIIPDRKEAIKTACIMAKTGDVILVAGKGHEKYQEIEGVKHPFDDRKVVNEIFKTYE